MQPCATLPVLKKALRALWVLLALLAVALSAGAQSEGAVANIPEAPELPAVVEEVAPPLPSSDDVVDMTPFQQAYDREVAAEQAEANGSTGDAQRRNAAAGADSTGALALRAAAALAAICGAIILLGWIARRFGGKTPLLAGTQLAQVLGRTHLEPKAALHFVKTGGRVLVVGVTPTGMHLITEFEAEQFEQGLATVPEPAPLASAQRPSSAEANFLAKLREQQERASASALEANDELDSLRSDIQRLKQYLQENRRGTGL
jgi:flagellar biogenesis protein FliO